MPTIPTVNDVAYTKQLNQKNISLMLQNTKIICKFATSNILEQKIWSY